MISTEPWAVFYYMDWMELAAYTVRGTFPGEMEETKNLLAYEHGVRPTEINVRIENRPRSRKEATA